MREQRCLELRIISVMKWSLFLFFGAISCWCKGVGVSDSLNMETRIDIDKTRIAFLWAEFR
jgi:hypothetical protein